MSKQWRFLLPGLMLSLFAVANNGFLVAPTHLDLDCARPSTDSFVVTNTGGERIHIRISPQCYTTGSKSIGLGKDLYPATASRVCIDQYLLVSPRVIALNPGERRIVRISLRAPGDLKPGGYRAHLLFSMIENADTLKQQGKGNDGKDLNMRLNILFEMATSIYCKKGDGQPILKAACIPEKKQFTIDFTNKTPWRYHGFLKIHPKNQAENVSQIPFIMLRESRQSVVFDQLPKNVREFVVEWSPAEGFENQGQINCHTLND